MNIDALSQAGEVEGFAHCRVLASQVPVVANWRLAHDDAEIGAEAGYMPGNTVGCQQMANAFLELLGRLEERSYLGLVRQDVQRSKPGSEDLDGPVEGPGVEDASTTRR